MIHRKIGKLLIGQATPFQILAACLLGSWIGFMPGVIQAPGSILILLALLAVLNANLWLAAAVTIIMKGLSIALLPLSHGVGTFLLEGPTEGIFRTLVNAPFLAWCGFEYHAVTGGWVVGGVFGLLLGGLLARGLSKLRCAFLGLDAGSEKFRAFVSKKWVRITSWLLLGAAPKRSTLEKLAGKRIGMPVRPLGAVLVMGLGVLFWIVPSLLAEPILTGALRGGLERANGATVDLEKAEIDLGAGRFTLSGLAMADRNALERDVLAATTVTADLDVRALLSRRWKIEDLVIEQAASGTDRKTPGTVVTKKDPTPPTPPPAPPEPEDGTEIVTLDDLLEDAKEWQKKLEQAKKVFDWVVGGDETSVAEETASVSPRWSRAEHLIEKSPTVLLDHLRIARLEALQIGGTLLEVEGWNLSTQPELVASPAGFSIASTDGTFRVAVNESEVDQTPLAERLVFRRSGISGDAVGEQVRYHGSPLLAGGTIDIEGGGRWWRENGVSLDLPLKITLNECEVRIPGSDRMERIARLEIPIQLSGTLTSPHFRFDQADLIDGLIAAGRQELADRARSVFNEKLGAETDRLKESLTEKLDEEIGDKLGDEAKKAVEKLGGGLLDRFKPKSDD